jgi:hypothetical protein
MQIVANSPRDLEVGQYDVAIVLPSHGEAYLPLRMLHSIVADPIVADTRVAACLVINHAKGAPVEAIASNQRTKTLCVALWQNADPPADLASDEESVGAGIDVAAYRKVAENIGGASTKVRLLVIDLFSEGHEPDACNVGIARREGCAAALRLLKESGVLVVADADSWLEPNFLSELVKEYADPAVLAATGEVRFWPEARSRMAHALSEAANALGRAHRMLHAVIAPAPPESREHDYTMPGTFMTMRPHVYRESGGFGPISGGEDIELSLRILKGGTPIRYLDGPKVSTTTRVSLRTDPGHGLGQDVARRLAHVGEPGAYPVASFDALCSRRRLLADLEAARAAGGDAGMETALRRFEIDCPAEAGLQRLGEEEIAAFLEAYRLAPNIAYLRDNDFFLNEVDRVFDRRFPRIGLAAALDALWIRLDGLDPQFTKRFKHVLDRNDMYARLIDGADPDRQRVDREARLIDDLLRRGKELQAAVYSWSYAKRLVSWREVLRGSGDAGKPGSEAHLGALVDALILAEIDMSGMKLMMDRLRPLADAPKAKVPDDVKPIAQAAIGERLNCIRAHVDAAELAASTYESCFQGVDLGEERKAAWEGLQNALTRSARRAEWTKPKPTTGDPA